MIVHPPKWDAHSENVQETAKGKMSHRVSTALIFHRTASPFGDANVDYSVAAGS
jgi:hypothetical protein